MKTSSLEILEKSKLPPEQARAILCVMETEIADRDESLVARGELHALELKLEEVRSEIKALGTRLVLWMFGMVAALGGFLFTVLNRTR